MSLPEAPINPQVKPNLNSYRVVIFILFGLLTLTIILLPVIMETTTRQPKVGDVLSTNLSAPKTLTYVSEILTREARHNAADDVESIYLPADPAISRKQIEKLQISLDYITIVRQDQYADREQKLNDLSSLQYLHPSRNTLEQVLTFSDNQWQTIQDESLRVLEQIMRDTIREGDIAQAQEKVPTLISYSLPQDNAAVVADLVTNMIIANSIYDLELTAAAKQEAQDAVEPVTRTFIIGESIGNRGQIITPLIWEAMEQYGLAQPTSNSKLILTSTILVVLICYIIFQFYRQQENSLIEKILGLVIVTLTFLIFLLGARIAIPGRTVIPYIFPISAFALTIAGIYSLDISIIFAIFLSILAAYRLPNSLDLTVFFMLTSISGVYALGKGRRIANFFAAGLTMGAIGSAIIIAYRVPDNTTDLIGIATLIAASFFNGLLSSSLTLLLRYLFAQILRVITPLQLMEIARPDHPLLQHLLQNAPGTYQHSLQVANLAERAAEAIGADSLLTRVGAIFHDAGKAENPNYFIENQIPGQENPHNALDPITSASVILQHVPDSVKLAKKYKIPPRIQDFMREHHGTLMTRYQYSKALQAANNNPDAVDIELFRYQGPAPTSRETALVMFADGCEARARAELPTNEEQLRNLVKDQFAMYQREGQLDNTSFTLRDLNLAIDSFVNTLRNTHHLRIKYPEAITMAKIDTVSEISSTKSNDPDIPPDLMSEQTQ